jgi:hypothetical protein
MDNGMPLQASAMRIQINNHWGDHMRENKREEEKKVGNTRGCLWEDKGVEKALLQGDSPSEIQ